MMADAKHLLEFLEGGIGMLFDLGLEFLRVELAPVSPACFRGQRAFFGGVQIPINGTPGQVKPPGGLGFGAPRLDEVHHPLAQVQRISFHALKPITLCPNVNMKCYSQKPSQFKINLTHFVILQLRLVPIEPLPIPAESRRLPQWAG